MTADNPKEEAEEATPGDPTQDGETPASTAETSPETDPGESRETAEGETSAVAEAGDDPAHTAAGEAVPPIVETAASDENSEPREVPADIADDGQTETPADGEPVARELLERMAAVEAALAERLSNIECAARELIADQRERDEHIRNREALYDKLQASRSTFQYQFVRPMVQRMASLHDLIHSFHVSPPQDDDGWKKTLELFLNHLEQTLEIEGVQRLAPSSGAEFDDRYHHIVDTRPTPDAELNGRIAEVTQPGFLYFGRHDASGEIRPTPVRPVKVVTWKYDEQAAEFSPPVNHRGQIGKPAAPVEDP